MRHPSSRHDLSLVTVVTSVDEAGEDNRIGGKDGVVVISSLPGLVVGLGAHKPHLTGQFEGAKVAKMLGLQSAGVIFIFWHNA